MTARPMTEAELDLALELARQIIKWSPHSSVATHILARALLSTSAAERGMREALQLFRDHYPRGINPWLDEAHSKARAALSGIEGEDEQATRAAIEKATKP